MSVVLQVCNRSCSPLPAAATPFPLGWIPLTAQKLTELQSWLPQGQRHQACRQVVKAPSRPEIPRIVFQHPSPSFTPELKDTVSLLWGQKLQSIATKHRKASPQRKRRGGGEKLLITLSPSHSPPLGFYKVILAHDARRDTLQHRRSRALPDHHTHEIQQHKSRTTFFYKSKKRREGGTLWACGEKRRWHRRRERRGKQQGHPCQGEANISNFQSGCTLTGSIRCELTICAV